MCCGRVVVLGHVHISELLESVETAPCGALEQIPALVMDPRPIERPVTKMPDVHPRDSVIGMSVSAEFTGFVRLPGVCLIGV